MFIVFEGLDGSGSSTQVAILEKNLIKKGFKVQATKEPTTLTIGSLVRQYLQKTYTTSAKALQLLFAADREDHLEKVVRPALKDGKIVISDRYLYSSIAFGARSDEEFRYLEDLYYDFETPDLVFLLKVNPKTCIKRIENRGNEKELFEQEEVLKRVWQNYEKLSQNNTKIILIDGEQTISQIEKEVLLKVLEN